jgi:serine/threonine protein kinase
MSTQIGRFEILSEIAKSERATVYKANDPTSGQTIALKTVRLDMPADQVKGFMERVLAEADTIKNLNSQNIAVLYGVGDIEEQLCASMEYVQGNSVATMIARKEGFSIWDLLDISRQVCQGLDHAHSHNVFHFSLEPAKVMVQWDGTVKILSFGISTMSFLEAEASGSVAAALHYVSPEQLQGEPLDARSNLFSWGAVLYEMVTDRRPFDAEDADGVRQNILEKTPAPPAELNPKIHSSVSQLIMKALSKAPDQRFQSGQDLVNELEKCKQASTQAAKKSNSLAQGLMAPKTVSPTATRPASRPASPPAAKSPASQPREAASAKAASSKPFAREDSTPPAKRSPESTSANATSHHKEEVARDQEDTPATPAPPKKAAAAAAGWSGSAAASPRLPKLDPSAQFISSVVKASVDAIEKQEQGTQTKAAKQSDHATAKPVHDPMMAGDAPVEKMSAAVAEPAEAESPAFAVDPMMAEDGPGARKAVSFSDLEELPPLKEVFLAPPPPSEPAATIEEPPPPVPVRLRPREPQKPKVPPREVAQKAIKEIKSVPPQLVMYSISAAVVLILVIVAGIAYHIHSQNADEDNPPAASHPSPQAAPAPPPAPVQAAVPAAIPAPEPIEAPTHVRVAPVIKSRAKRRAAAPAPAPTIIPGQLAIDSTPEGAQVRFDGRTDASWVTPYNLTGLAPGQHSISVSKAGYTAETRNVEIGSGSKSFLVIHLAPAAATVAVNSDPPGASVYVDGKDTGRLTPTQISVDKGTHTLLVKKQGYLDETASADLQPGQTFRFAPALRSMGNVDDIKTVGKVKKLFGGGGIPTGMGLVSIKTQPKGAQIAVNRRLLDKNSPVEFLLGPGNYVVDITASGYKPIHRVINVDKGNKIMLDETMEPE